MCVQRNRVRLEETRRQYEGLRATIGEWIGERRRKDRFGQYSTQLQALEKILLAALERLESRLDDVSPAGSSGVVYTACRKAEIFLLWILRLWTYFRDKFDQRDDSRLGRVLAAADEVVWSCYAGAFRNAEDARVEVERGAAPLPYVTPHYSPQALLRVGPPAELQHEFLAEYLNALPIPLVSLPSTCVDAPWWLVYLGHEVGHHVQFELLPDGQLVRDFRERLGTAVRDAPEPRGEEEDARRWEAWGREIFADAFSVLGLGHWATWSMGELVMAEDASMLSHCPTYPSPLVRLALMDGISEKLGGKKSGALGGLELRARAPAAAEDETLRRRASRDMTFVPKVVRSAVGEPLLGSLTFPQLVGFRADDFAERGRTDLWRDVLLGKADPYPEKTLEAPRLVVSGAVAAWARVSAMDDPERRARERRTLERNIPEILVENREEGTRSAPPVPSDRSAELGDRLVEVLLGARPEDLEL
jgi:hypothetical protein